MTTMGTNVQAILQRCNTIITENLALATTVAALSAKVDALKAEVDQIKTNTDTPPGDIGPSPDEVQAQKKIDILTAEVNSLTQRLSQANTSVKNAKEKT